MPLTGAAEAEVGRSASKVPLHVSAASAIFTFMANLTYALL
jgi:hypothetical protein